MTLPNDLQPEHLAGLLTAQRPGSHLQVEECLPSTNESLLARISEKIPEGFVLVADHQTAGRGRMQRSWFNRPGKDLLFSVYLQPKIETELLASLVLAVGLASYEAIGEKTGRPTELKWPNDILLNGKKVCGILCQAVIGQTTSVVVGVGINVNSTAADLPDELGDTATTMHAETGVLYDRGELLAFFLGKLDKFYGLWQTDHRSVFAEWERRSAIRGRRVKVVAEETFYATAQGLDEQGRLIVEVNGKTQLVASGDLYLAEER